MLIQSLLFATCFLGQSGIESVHAQNSVFSRIVERGIDIEGQTIKLPLPRLHEGQTADAQRAALLDVAGSERALDDMLRDSVTAPFIIRVHDIKVGAATLRSADLWFVAHGELKQTNLLEQASRVDQKEVEVANMWFQTRMLKADRPPGAEIKEANPRGSHEEWFVHVHARLLDRIDFEVTNHVVATQTADSIIVASQTDPNYDKGGPLASRWKSLKANEGSVDATGHEYAGGISYAKVERLRFKPGALLVEMHFAFVEPDAWFQGSPILRSKFSVAAQDQIRTLRREMAKKRAK